MIGVGNDDPTFSFNAAFKSANDDVGVPTCREFKTMEAGQLYIVTDLGNLEIDLKPGDKVEFLIPDKVKVNGTVRIIPAKTA
jgi:hypothetical protein